MSIKKFLARISVAAIAALFLASPGVVVAQDHLVITSQDASVGKEIAVYEPDGTKIFSHVTEGAITDNTPTFIVSDPDTQRFMVSCPGPDTSTTTDNQSVLVFDASDTENITLVSTLRPGLKPFHAELSPDGKFVVANDKPGTVTIIDPANPGAANTITGGLDHATLVFAGDASGYDIYASRFGNPGGMDIVDGDTLTVRAQHTGLLANPHTGVYSPYTQRAYYGHMGGIEVYGTTGAEQDLHLDTISLDAGKMIPLSNVSPDGRYLYGGVHYDGAAGSYFYSVDLSDDSVTSVTSVSCKYYAFSPDGNWLVAGDFNKPTGQTDYHVHVISADPASPDFMTVVKEFNVAGSKIGFHTAAFSPDSRYAYLGLPTTDQIMVVDVEELDAQYIDLPTNSVPKWLRVMTLTGETAVRNWVDYR